MLLQYVEVLSTAVFVHLFVNFHLSLYKSIGTEIL